MHRMDYTRLRSQSVDDEDCYGYRHCCHSALNSDSEYSGSVSVRDMVRHYDSQMRAETATAPSAMRFKGTQRRQFSNHLLCDGKMTHCDDARIWENHNRNNAIDDDAASIGCCKNCSSCRCCQNRSRKNSNGMKKACSNEMLNNLNVKDIVARNKKKNNNDLSGINNAVDGSNGVGWLELKDDNTIVNSSAINNPCIRENNCFPTIDNTEEANCHPIETSYQSKTTIAKTASGVRIIIDIFFDQEHQQHCMNKACDVLGSRVETEIPQSRILNEFQQQSTSLKL